MNDVTAKLAEALRRAVKQGEHDMLPTGEELRDWSEALRLYDAAKAQPMQDEREEFEAWLQKCHPGAVGAELIGKEENSPHTYVYFGVNKQWAAWKARAALVAKAPQTVYQLSPTDIYDFAGWLTTRKESMQVGSSHEAAQMAEAVGEYLKTYPERFTPAPATEATPAQAQQAHWTPEQVLRTQEIAAELKAKIKHKPLTEQEVAEAVFDYYQHFSDPQDAAEACFDKDLAVFRLAERACAEAWGVKLAGIGASAGEKE